MKKKILKALALASVCSLVLASFTACGSSDEAGTEPAAESEAATDEAAANETSSIDTSAIDLMTDGVLTVGVEIGYPPFESYADDGTTPIGVDIEIMTAIAEKLGLEVNFVDTAWDGIFAGIDVNYDCVCSAVTITSERQQTMLFSTPYIDNYQSVVVMADSDLEVTSFHDLDGKTIAVQKETTSDELMSDYNDTNTISVQIVANEKVTSCFSQLENGEIDAVVCDSTVADGQLAKNSNYKLAYEDNSEAEQFGVAMGLENEALQTAINQALVELEEEGTIDEILNYWFGGDAE